jgi:hypothetical protein
MKSRTVAITIAVLALPIYAADQQKPNTNTTTTTLSVPVSMEPTDSPLVRAAKATGRLGKKPGYVITNDTLLRVGSGHIAMSTSQGAALPVPPKAPAVAPQPPPTNPKPKADAGVRQRVAADYNGESAEASQIDPAVLEHQMQQAAAPKPPQN